MYSQQCWGFCGAWGLNSGLLKAVYELSPPVTLMLIFKFHRGYTAGIKLCHSASEPRIISTGMNSSITLKEKKKGHLGAMKLVCAGLCTVDTPDVSVHGSEMHPQ